MAKEWMSYHRKHWVPYSWRCSSRGKEKLFIGDFSWDIGIPSNGFKGSFQLWDYIITFLSLVFSLQWCPKRSAGNFPILQMRSWLSSQFTFTNRCGLSWLVWEHSRNFKQVAQKKSLDSNLSGAWVKSVVTSICTDSHHPNNSWSPTHRTLPALHPYTQA